jgi:hypothetical protein
MKCNVLPFNYARLIDFAATYNNPTRFLAIAFVTAGVPLVGIGSPSIGTNVNTNMNYTIPNLNWHHLAFVFQSNGVLNFYADGTLITGVSYTSYPPLVALTSSFIGKSNFPADPYTNCFINQFVLFNRPITSTEVSYLYNYPAQVGFSSAATGIIVTSNVYPCFLQGSKILRFNPETYQDEYAPVETLRKGDLIPTAESGYKLIHAIGHRTIPQPKNDPNPSNRLYTFTNTNCPSVFEPLHITGEHCTLHRNVSASKLVQIKEHMGDVYITEEFYRMPAHVDDRAEPYEGPDEPATIWHFALENEYDTYNYGVYANGLIVESSSMRSLLEKSGMQLIE